ncbi:Na+/H+ antiporter NhaC family protein [uncultured Oscillibacter sp.]|uniref:Na+/H+ antiporter NhaC family protein n=1 Tax=uncultured Oscillibacter sp. TaxID=876091 RepID=UPI0026344D08|nr:Na+/H+ antiporter NhaC family protein [uncultured Oscillibacter sp.]
MNASYAKTLILLVIPVIMIVLMLKGWNLIAILVVCDLEGIVLCLALGFIDFETMASAVGPIGAGMTGMLNVILFSFFIFALLEMLTRSGVFDIMLEKASGMSKTPRQTELICVLLCVVGSIASGAASITILFIGPIVHKLMQQHHIEPTQGANIIDGFSTALAGIVPYNPVGMNVVSPAIASGVVGENFSFLDYLPYNFHSMMLILLFGASILTGFGRKFEAEKP